MKDEKQKVCIVGAGSLGTALAQAMVENKSLDIILYSIEPEVVKCIKEESINCKYFPNIRLNPDIKISDDISVIRNVDFLLLAIPSIAIPSFIRDHKHIIGNNTIIVNLAKGFGEGNHTIIDVISNIVDNPVCTLKGPGFAREIINGMPTALTLAAKDISLHNKFIDLFKGTTLYTDFSTDITGVELCSILKNIYAIVIGIVDAHFDSPNLRSLMFTRAIVEMKKILIDFGGNEETIFNYCGIGDLSLTSLNDLSRNRTLGLLIGKGFFDDSISDKVVLEGKIAVNVFCEEIAKRADLKVDYPIIAELYDIFNGNANVSGFVNRLLEKC
ncbi:MAG: NAD(P)H-dependent glycerol-3-phosphate dehydrogenase [Hyphomicrobiales bacterium]